MPRNILIAMVIALCSGAAQAQFEGASLSGGASAPATSTNIPELPSSGSGSALDLQPSAASGGSRCDRLTNGNIVKTGGLMNENMKIQTEYCKWTESIPSPQ